MKLLLVAAFALAAARATAPAPTLVPVSRPVVMPTLVFVPTPTPAFITGCYDYYYADSAHYPTRYCN
jgi:hypothetical protein